MDRIVYWCFFSVGWYRLFWKVTGHFWCMIHWLIFQGLAKMFPVYPILYPFLSECRNLSSAALITYILYFLSDCRVPPDPVNEGYVDRQLLSPPALAAKHNHQVYQTQYIRYTRQTRFFLAQALFALIMKLNLNLHKPLIRDC